MKNPIKVVVLGVNDIAAIHEDVDEALTAIRNSEYVKVENLLLDWKSNFNALCINERIVHISGEIEQ